jgi:hypothetical protein
MRVLQGCYESRRTHREEDVWVDITMDIEHDLEKDKGKQRVNRG